MSGEPVGQRKRPFGGDESVEKQVAKRRKAGTGERSDRHLMTKKVRRSSLRTVRMIATPEKSFESGEEGAGGAGSESETIHYTVSSGCS